MFQRKYTSVKTIYMTINRYFFLAIFLFLFPGAVVCLAEEMVSPLLLTFDVELDGDAEYLDSLDLQEFATFFVTGEFARNYPEKVKSIADQGTVGLYSKAYEVMTEKGLAIAKSELQQSITAIAEVTGRSPVWFRVPAFEVNRSLFSLARELGLKYDSSESERWISQEVLSEFPISNNSTGRIRFSDYDIFVTYGLEDQMALDLLKENYLNRKNSGRPFVLVLHPSIISQHAEVLNDFIKYVKQQGGPCMSFDQFFARFEQIETKQIGIRLDSITEDFDVKKVVRDLLELGITDAFVSGWDKDGQPFIDPGRQDNKHAVIFDRLLKSLTAAGIRIHLTVSVLHNPYLIDQDQEMAMVDRFGQYSDSWISPSNAAMISFLKKSIKALVVNYNIYGIHLDKLLYPGLEYDFSSDTIERYERENKVSIEREQAGEILLGEHHDTWLRWRAGRLEELLRSITKSVVEINDKIVFSAALPYEALINFRQMEKTGVDFRLLGQYLDMIVIRPNLNEFFISNFSLSHLVTMSRAMIGGKKLLLQIPSREGIDWSEFAVSHLFRELGAESKGGLAGIIYPSYTYLQAAPVFRGQEYKNIYQMSDRFSQIDAEKSLDPQKLSFSLNERPQPAPKAMVEETVQQKSLSEKKMSTEDVMRRLAPLIISLLVTLLLLVILSYFLFYKRVFSRKEAEKMETTTVINWQSMDESILDEQVSGKLVHAVSKMLQHYNPMSTAKYRRALLLDIVAGAAGKMSVDELLALPLDIQDWKILGKSCFDDALLNGYIEENQGILSLTEKGTLELSQMIENGFNAGQWIFVEQRMLEYLLVVCPKCGTENTAQWYWSSFLCSGCKESSTFKQCDSIVRKSTAHYSETQGSIIM